MTLINKIYLKYKKDDKFKTKIIIFLVLLAVLCFLIWNNLNDHNCLIPINITKDSIMRLTNEPKFLIPPPFLNFCNQ